MNGIYMFDTILTTIGFIIQVVKDYGFKGLLLLAFLILLYVLFCGVLFEKRNWKTMQRYGNWFSDTKSDFKQSLKLWFQYFKTYVLRPKKWSSMWK